MPGLVVGFDFGLALGLRMWGIAYDLPLIYHPDEPVNLSLSLQIFKTGDLNPHFFNYPSLFFYLNALAYIPFYGFGKLIGVFASRGDLLSPVSLGLGITYAPMPSLVLLGRSLTLAFGVGSVLLVYLSGKQLTRQPFTGLLAVGMLAVSPTNVALSRVATPDIMVTFWILGAFWAAVLLSQHGKTWPYIVGGLCVGLAAGSKYNGALIGLALIAAHFLRSGLQGFRDFASVLAAAFERIRVFDQHPLRLA